MGLYSRYLKDKMLRDWLDKNLKEKDFLINQSQQLDRIEKQTQPNYLRGIGENIAGNAIYSGLLYILKRLLR